MREKDFFPTTEGPTFVFWHDGSGINAKSRFQGGEAIMIWIVSPPDSYVEALYL